MGKPLTASISCHTAILDELEKQLSPYEHQHHLWRMQAMGIIDSLTGVFLRIPVPEEERIGLVERMRALSHRVTTPIFELRVNERRPEVMKGVNWDPIADMIKHCGSDPHRRY